LWSSSVIKMVVAFFDLRFILLLQLFSPV